MCVCIFVCVCLYMCVFVFFMVHVCDILVSELVHPSTLLLPPSCYLAQPPCYSIPSHLLATSLSWLLATSLSWLLATSLLLLLYPLPHCYSVLRHLGYLVMYSTLPLTYYSILRPLAHLLSTLHYLATVLSLQYSSNHSLQTHSS